MAPKLPTSLNPRYLTLFRAALGQGQTAIDAYQAWRASEPVKGDFILRSGMTLAVEPMVVAGRRDVQLLDDGWTVITEDKKPAAHFEHTIAVTPNGVEILTDGGSPYQL